MHNRLLATGILGIALGVAGVATAATKAPAPDGPAGRVLETLAAAPYQVQLVIEPCVERSCPIGLRLLEHGHLLDSVTLPVPAATQDAVLQRENGDGWEMLRLFDPKQHFWRAGGEDRPSDFTVTALRLAGHQRALLVTQQSGSESLRRVHSLYTVGDQKWVAAWRFDEGDNPERTQAYAVPLAADQAVAFVRWHNLAWGEGDGDIGPDPFSVELLDWDGTLRTLAVPTPAAPLYGVVAGLYPSLVEARTALRAQGNTVCLSDLKPLVFSAARFPELKAEGAVLGYVLGSAAAAERYKAELARCIGSSDVHVLVLTREAPAATAPTPEPAPVVDASAPAQ